MEEILKESYEHPVRVEDVIYYKGFIYPLGPGQTLRARLARVLEECEVLYKELTRHPELAALAAEKYKWGNLIPNLQIVKK